MNCQELEEGLLSHTHNVHKNCPSWDPKLWMPSTQPTWAFLPFVYEMPHSHILRSTGETLSCDLLWSKTYAIFWAWEAAELFLLHPSFMEHPAKECSEPKPYSIQLHFRSLVKAFLFKKSNQEPFCLTIWTVDLFINDFKIYFHVVVSILHEPLPQERHIIHRGSYGSQTQSLKSKLWSC